MTGERSGPYAWPRFGDAAIVVRWTPHWPGLAQVQRSLTPLHLPTMHGHTYTVQPERWLRMDRQSRGWCPLPAWDEICQLTLTARKEQPPLPSQTWLHCLQDRCSHEHTGQENRICSWSREMPALSLVQKGPQPVCPRGPQPCCRPPSPRSPGMLQNPSSTELFPVIFLNTRFGSDRVLGSHQSCLVPLR